MTDGEALAVRPAQVEAAQVGEQIEPRAGRSSTRYAASICKRAAGSSHTTPRAVSLVCITQPSAWTSRSSPRAESAASSSPAKAGSSGEAASAASLSETVR